MDHLENQLRRTMRPKDPPPDFAARVMAHVQRPKPQPSWSFFSLGSRVAFAGGLAMVMLAGVGGAYYEHQQTERRRAAAARQQILQALQITSAQLTRAGHALAPSEVRQ